MPSISDVSRDLDDAWILSRRPAKNAVDPRRPYAFMVEPECAASGVVQDVATIFLTNKECPLRCLMCDLWKNTTDAPVPPGAIPEQIRWAFSQLDPAPHVKLYNSGNFFDPEAIPERDDPEIAALVAHCETVTVESHPKMVKRRCLAFNDMLPGDLHVAMGLETVHPEVLSRLNKRMTLDDFASAAETLRSNGMCARAFILLRPPFLTESEGVTWARKSIDFAFDMGVECCAIIPTRGGNGAMEALAARGEFHPPTLDSLEDVFEYGLSKAHGRVLVDLWDIENLAADAPDAAARVARLKRMNLSQQSEPRP